MFAGTLDVPLGPIIEPNSARWTQDSKCHPSWVTKAVPWRRGVRAKGKRKGVPQKEAATTGDPAFQAPGINRLGLRAHRGRRLCAV